MRELEGFVFVKGGRDKFIWTRDYLDKYNVSSTCSILRSPIYRDAYLISYGHSYIDNSGDKIHFIVSL